MALFRKTPREARDCLLPGGDTVDVVGESHYQDALLATVGGRCEDGADRERWAHLILEPDNPYDRNAVAVYIDGLTIGYLSRTDAQDYQPILTQLWDRYALRGVCRANIRGGWDRGGGDVGSFGVKLALAQPEHLLGDQSLPYFDPDDPPPLREDATPMRAQTQGRPCAACGALLTKGAKFCGGCGAAIAPLWDDKCQACAADLVAGAKFCGECGAPTTPAG